VAVVRIEENIKSRVTFCFMVLTTFCVARPSLASARTRPCRCQLGGRGVR
jgi:hypothetical protein